MAAYDITTSAANLNYNSSNNSRCSLAKIDTNHFLVLFQSTSSFLAQVIAVNTTTWVCTTTQASNFSNGAPNIDFVHAPAFKVDTNHMLVLYDHLEAANAQIYTINTTTWAITTAATTLVFATASAAVSVMAKVDTNHFLGIFAKAGGNAQMFTVNTTTWAVTTSSARFTFDTQEGEQSAVAQVDTNHFIIWWVGGASKRGFTQVLTVNTTTWAVTTAAASLEYYAVNETGSNTACFQIDTNHFINFWKGADFDGFVQVFTVNTTTWAVTTAAAALEFGPSDGMYNSCYRVDTNHFINFYRGASGDGFAQCFAVNTSTWEVTTVGASVEFDTQNGNYNSCWQVDTSHFINTWSGGSSGTDGLIQIFAVQPPPDGPVGLKTWNGLAKLSVKDINGLPMPDLKSWNGLE